MIQLTNISYGYSKKHNLFESLNLKIPEGNIYGLLGKNGAGKTTLLKVIAGLLFPKEGEAEVFGFSPRDRQPSFLADIYFAPEELYVPTRMKIDKYVNFYAPFYPKFDRDQFNEYLKTFEIPTDQRLIEMSYGQKKKFVLCFGLAANTRLLILDEPTNGLDIPSKSRFRSLLAGAMTDDRTVIISTHQVRDMANLIDPIIILEDGKILFQSSLEEITRKLYFEMVPSLSPPDNALYAERAPGGYLTVTENAEGFESDMDIEVLFNAIVTNRERINTIFN